MSNQISIMTVMAIFVMAVFSPFFAAGDPWIDEIALLEWGSPRDELFGDTSVIFGPPTGVESGVSASLNVLNIGRGGVIVLEFTDNVIFDGPGPDFTIFENPFYRLTGDGGADDTRVFSEPAYVSVSDTATTWALFPNDYTGPDPLTPGQDPNPAWFNGFAGIRPVFSAPDNGISPFDPNVSGGDAFDLADVAARAATAGVDINNIRFIRIQDCIVGVDVDEDGDVIPTAVGAANGFDLDSIAALNTFLPGGVLTASDPERWDLYE